MKAEETLKLLSKQWCSLQDLMKLLSCGRNKALIVKKTIKNELIKEGYIVPNNSLPMKAVVDALKIDINYLKEISKINQ